MKLNQTYRLEEVFAALDQASDNIYRVIEDMKASQEYSRAITQFSTSGMLTQSHYARVTFTHQETDRNGNDVVVGYMETSLFPDGPRTEVKVTMHYDMIAANDDWTEFKILDGNNKVKYILTAKK